MKVRSYLLVLIFHLFAFYTASAQQCTIRVPQDQASLFLAAGEANDGETVCVAPGTYQGPLIINKAISLIATSNDPTKTILESSDGQPLILLNSDSGLVSTLSGFTIRDATDQYNGAISASGDSVLSVHDNIFVNDALAFNGETVDFENNTISGIPAGVHCEANGGVQIGGITSHTDGNGNPLTSYIAHNTFTGSGVACAGYGIQPIPGNGVTIEDNRFTGLYYGIVIPAAVPTTPVSPQIIRQNLFYGNTDGAIYVAHNSRADGTSTPPADAYILNNTFVNNLAAPDAATEPAAVKFTDNTPFFPNLADFSTPAGTIVFANNIISESSAGGVALDCGTLDTQAPATWPVVSNNIVWAPSGTAVKGDCGPSKFLINQNPKLVSATDFHVAGGSPAIDAGNNSAPNLATTDFDGNARIQGTGSVPVIDIGPYETSETTGTTYATSLTPSTYVVTDTTPITLTAKVTANGGADNGSVSFYRLDGTSGTLLGTKNVDGTGTATLTSVAVPLTGNNTYYAISTRGVQSLPVYVDSTYVQPIDITLSLVSSANPSNYGQSTTFTATVSPEQNGTVSFFDGNTQLGTDTLNNGSARIITASLSVGLHSITAKFLPASGSRVTNSITQTVQAVASGTVLTATPTTVTVGGAVQLKVAVSAASSTAISGTVTFTDNGNAIGPPQTVSGTTSTNVTVSTSNFAVGNHTITATFTPDSNSQAGASTSNAITITVNAATIPASVTTISATPNPAVEGTQIPATIKVSGPAGAVISGTVKLYEGANLLNTATLSGTTSALASYTAAYNVGTHTLTAIFTPSGTATVQGSTSQSYTLTITPATQPGTPDFRATISPGALSITVAQPTTATLSFTPLGNFTGPLTLRCGTLPSNITCQLPQTITLDGKTTVTAALTLNATVVAVNDPLHKGWIAAALLTPAIFFLCKRRQIAVLLCATLALFALTGCGTVVELYSAAHTLTITATGTSQGSSTAITHTVPVNIAVHL